MDFVVDIYTTEKGFIQCKLKRTTGGFVYADLWKSGGIGDLDNTFTLFRAAVWLQWDGVQHSIVEPKRYKNCRDFWIELERQISNTIIVNE